MTDKRVTLVIRIPGDATDDYLDRVIDHINQVTYVESIDTRAYYRAEYLAALPGDDRRDDDDNGETTYGEIGD